MATVLTAPRHQVVLRGEGSRVLPLLQRQDILRFLQASQTAGETTWIREFRQWVRAQIASTNCGQEIIGYRIQQDIWDYRR